MEDLDSILAIVFSLGMPVMIVFIVMLFYYLNNRRKYHLAEEMVKAGVPVPDSLFEAKKKDTTPEATLTTGLVWIAVGIGAVVFGLCIDELAIVGLASVPMLIGVAYTIVYCVKKKVATREQPADETADPDSEA